METYARSSSFPESGDSSPASREVDSRNAVPWEEQPSSNNCKVKLMCSYGGKIVPRPHDNQLCYVGGDTKILAVDRSIKYSDLMAKVTALCDAGGCFKYQLPGEDLDALISVTNDDDLEHMMHEYDRLGVASSKSARLRLFLFPMNPPETTSPASFGSSEERNDKEKFASSLNSGPVHPSPGFAPPGNVDFLSVPDKGVPLQPPPVEVKLQDPIPISGISDPVPADRVADADLIQRHIQDLRIGAQEHAMYRRRSDDNQAGGFPGDCYAQKFTENVMQTEVSAPAGYWPERQVAGGVFPAATTPGPEQPVYMMPAPAAIFHVPVGRPVTGPTGQSYYTVQRAPQELYRDQPSVYNVVSPAMAPPSIPHQPPPKVSGLSEAGYAAPTMGYDGVGGRQVYYNAAGAVVATSYQGVVSGDMGASGALNQEGKVGVKTPQAYV